MARRKFPKTTIKLLPTDEKQVALDDTWARCGLLMNIVDDIMVRTGEIAHTVSGSIIVDELLKTADGGTMSIRMLDSCVRTVSRHLTAHQDDLSDCRIDWTNPPAPVEFSITGRVVGILRGGDVSIQTATGREQMKFELIEGDIRALKERDWLYFWMGDDAGEHIIQYRPGQHRTFLVQQTPAAKKRLDRIHADVRRRQIKKLIGTDVGAGG